MKNNPNDVLVLGGTGSIGSAVISILRARGHSVTCLVRSDKSEEALQNQGFVTLRGDISKPGEWVDGVHDFDCVIPVATTWGKDMAAVDDQLIECLIDALATPDAEKILLYTSGCWDYGNTYGKIATESFPHDPLPSYAWTIEIASRVLNDDRVKGMVIVPAMVYEHDGGVFEPMLIDAVERKRIRIVGSEVTRWPLVHRDDLAELYALMIERGTHGSLYNAAAITGIEIGKITAAISSRLGLSLKPEIISIEEALRTIGPWAEGYALDQRMSGQKAMRELGWAPKHTDVLKELA